MKVKRIQRWFQQSCWTAAHVAWLVGLASWVLQAEPAWSQTDGAGLAADVQAVDAETAAAAQAGGREVAVATLAVQEGAVEERADRKAGPGRNQDKKAKGPGSMDSFMRIRKNSRGKPVAMETSVTRYETTNAAGEVVTVDLIGVVHIGEKEYYEQLNKHFEQYDALLYELVAPEGTRIPEGGRGEGEGLNPLAAMQLGMKSMLELEFQLEHIDYNRENFIHADMSPEEFLESMKNNDESFGKMFLKAIGTAMASENRSQVSNADLFAAMLSKNPALRLRRTMAQQMRDMEGGMAMFEGREGSTIINHRNAKALEVMKRELASGKKKVALFYGAGHLPDMERRLMSDFQMKRGGQFWMEAWKLAE
ncbi:MAG: hypothetical protein ACK6A8_15280 [Planctomycetota bacterium]